MLEVPLESQGTLYLYVLLLFHSGICLHSVKLVVKFQLRFERFLTYMRPFHALAAVNRLINVICLGFRVFHVFGIHHTVIAYVLQNYLGLVKISLRQVNGV